MSQRVEIVERGESFNDSGIRNGWRCEWCDKTIYQRRAGEFIRNLKTAELVYCKLCEQKFSMVAKDLLLSPDTCLEPNTSSS